VALTVSLTLQTKMVDINKKIEINEQKTVPQNTAASTLAAAWAYGLEGYDLLQSLDDTLASLANIDLANNFKCKSSDSDKNLTDDENLFAGIEGCASYIGKAKSAIENENPTEAIGAVLDLIQNLLFQPSRFPSCAEEQFRKFLAVIPIQYYLLIILSRIAKEVSPKTWQNVVEQTTCGNSFSQIATFEDRIPNLEIPRIPLIPYIKIPSITDLIEKIFFEIWCVGFCITTTPIINKVAKELLNLGQDFANYLNEDNEFYTDNKVLLAKIPISPYLTDAAFDAAKKDKLIPQSVENEKIRKILSDVQNDSSIGQEEFIFLFLGQGNCNILDKLLKVPNITNLLGLNNENKILTFFKFLGSFVNFIDLIKKSQQNVCPPDICEVKEDDLEATIASVVDLCKLLNPSLGLPSLPLGALMEASGVNKFIVDNTYSSYQANAQINESYQPYISEYYTQSLTVVERLLNLDFSKGSEALVAVNKEGTSLNLYAKIIISQFGKEYSQYISQTKQTIIEDDKLTLSEIQNQINKYWVSNEKLIFINSESRIKPLSEISTNEEKRKQLRSISRRYLESSFPFVVLQLSGSGVEQPNEEYREYYDGWNIDNSEQISLENNKSIQDNEGVAVKANVYLQYTKKMLNDQLTYLQKSSKIDSTNEDMNKDMKDFIDKKEEFGLIKDA